MENNPDHLSYILRKQWMFFVYFVETKPSEGWLIRHNYTKNRYHLRKHKTGRIFPPTINYNQYHLCSIMDLVLLKCVFGIMRAIADDQNNIDRPTTATNGGTHKTYPRHIWATLCTQTAGTKFIL